MHPTEFRTNREIALLEDTLLILTRRNLLTNEGYDLIKRDLDALCIAILKERKAKEPDPNI